MDDRSTVRTDHPGRGPLQERVSADKRQFLKLVLGTITPHSVPLMAS